ncbi:phenolic glucoside malonyltransferase 2-like [Oryza brachyantha]|uniref:phenolic glucoside malonyltransferase 2-like n=1 Tax=Oryza brachyantha TaxID=4533 RepID=UPI001ADA393A|nr:phenolic glucoside malonyltransferase 2-like [Oryza brachyantha]
MAAPPPHGGVRVLRTEHVTPPASALSEDRAVPLTFLDATWLHAKPVERVFFYRLVSVSGADGVDGMLSKLADSLSQALGTFYPLAGRIRLKPGETNRYELFSQPGDGVAFTVAEQDGVSIEELATDVEREVAKIVPLVPALPEGGAVLAVQATILLPAPAGLALGITMHHAACDGTSSTHFLHTWAAACAAAEVSPEPPVIDRSFIIDRKDLHDVFARPIDRAVKKRFNPTDAIERLIATYTLSKEHLQSIKDIVTGEAARRGVPPPRCTSTVAAYGVMWMCHLRATQATGEPDPPNGGHAYFLFLTDHRGRLEPRVPSRYFGNCLGPCRASMPKNGAAIATVTDGLFTACSAVAVAVDEAVRREPGYWEGWPERIVEACRNGAPFTVAGSPRFRVYGVDFGFGKPAKVEIVSVARTGAMSVAEGRGGSDSIEVGIALPPDGMDSFRRCFDHVIACLAPSRQNDVI